VSRTSGNGSRPCLREALPRRALFAPDRRRAT
jgi:hypothetical protein